MMGNDDTEGPIGPDDATLLAAIGQLWQQVDQPPADLALGVLARLAAEDLEFDLLRLVETEDALAGVRSAAEASDAERADSGSWSLEYAGGDFRVYLRMSLIAHRTRIDGWVVPARPLIVRLLSEDTAADPLETPVDEYGRFEVAEAPSGLARLVFVDQTTTADRPRITPPFWI